MSRKEAKEVGEHKVTFMELLEDSVIVQSLVTLILIGVDAYLAVINAPIPDSLINATMLVLGFWFGSKMNQAGRRATKDIISGLRGEQ